jgi:hypothetical protein
MICQDAYDYLTTICQPVICQRPVTSPRLLLICQWSMVDGGCQAVSGCQAAVTGPLGLNQS